jgi:hypothetical protein
VSATAFGGRPQLVFYWRFLRPDAAYLRNKIRLKVSAVKIEISNPVGD